MCKSEFGGESYGRPKLPLPIRRGGAEIRAYPRFPLCLDFLSSGRRAWLRWSREVIYSVHDRPTIKTDYTMKLLVSM